VIGSSVDYSLHVAEAFVECSQQNRVSLNPIGRENCSPVPMLVRLQAGVWHALTMGAHAGSALVTQALTKIGTSVLHAALTTFLSVVMLLFCAGERISRPFGVLTAYSPVDLTVVATGCLHRAHCSHLVRPIRPDHHDIRRDLHLLCTDPSASNARALRPQEIQVRRGH
jgi:hypothetical protein